MDEDCIIIVNSNDIESKVVKIDDLQIITKEVLSFMARFTWFYYCIVVDN
jgi:hypothetical protein